MQTYVKSDSQNPVEDAIKALEALSFQKDENGETYYFYVPDEDYSKGVVLQVFDNDEVIEWGSPIVGEISPSDQREVIFFC